MSPSALSTGRLTVEGLHLVQGPNIAGALAMAMNSNPKSRDLAQNHAQMARMRMNLSNKLMLGMVHHTQADGAHPDFSAVG